jgi:hypothetical protein
MMTKKKKTFPPQPDAWMQLTLTTMTIAELQRELQTATGDDRRWMQDALQEKQQAAADAAFDARTTDTDDSRATSARAAVAPTTASTTAPPVTYSGGVPKTLRRFIDTHCAGTVYDVDFGGGFTTESGNAYDVGIVAGWKVDVAGDWMHTIMEPTVRDVIAILKTLTECHDCDECRAAWAQREGGAR